MAAAAAAGARKLAGTLRLLAAGRGSGCIPRARASPCETSFLPHRSYSAAKTGENGGATGGGKRSRIRRIVSIGVISIAGGVALSALNDLAIFHGCSRSYFSPFLPSRHSLSVYQVRAFFLRCSSLESLMLEHQYYPCNI